VVKAVGPEIPEIIKSVGFDFDWDERKVWTLNVPTEEMPIQNLIWHFDIPFWSKPGGRYDLCPRDIIDNPVANGREYERTMSANTSHPIDIMFWRGRWVLLDGLHRLVKLHIAGDQTVQVRKIPESAIPEIEKPKQENLE
jgi:hypothetical protein